MERSIKLIWDFRGPEAEATARHYEKHLKEYGDMEALPSCQTGHKVLGSAHSMAFMVVKESFMPKVRDTLKPHRGELHEAGGGTEESVK